MREKSDNFMSRCLVSVCALCNASQITNYGIKNAKPQTSGSNSKIVFGFLENQVFIVKHVSGKMFFGVNMTTAANHRDDDEILINAICDTGKAYKLTL